MNGVAVVGLTFAATYVILLGIRDGRHILADWRRRHSFLAHHQRNIRSDQLDREVRESHPIRWRR
jgi:hypothetical protein